MRSRWSQRAAMATAVGVAAGLWGLSAAGAATYPAPASAVIAVGSGPIGLAVSPDGSFAYVANSSASTVSRIRTSDDIVTATTGVGGRPNGIAISPDGTFAYVTSPTANTIFRIRTSDNSITATIASPWNPLWVSLSPDGSFAYVTSSSANSMYRIRTSDNAITARIILPSRSGHVAVSPDGTYAYATSPTANQVSRIRTADNTVAATVSVGTGPTGVAIAPNGTFAYVANQSSSSLSRLRTSDSTVTDTVGLGIAPNLLTVSPDSTSAYVTSRTNSMAARIDAVTNTVAAEFPVGSRPMAVAYAPAGTHAYIAHSGANSVWRIQAPDAPAAPQVTAVAGGANVTIAPPISGAAPSEYVVSSYPEGRTCTFKVPLTECQVVGLNAGATYTFTVVAVNGAGTSATSGMSAAVTPLPPVASAPTISTVTSEARAAKVFFTAPADTGGNPIIAYEYQLGSGTDWVNSVPAVTSSPLPLTGLNPGETYTVRLRAVTINGPGSESPAFEFLTLSLPGAPIDVRAYPDEGFASVYWYAPWEDNGSPITGYTATATPGSATCATTVWSQSCNVLGLTNGISYTFTVVAHSANGEGPASLPSNPVMPKGAPTPPTHVVAVGGSEEATISWTAPAGDGGSPVLNYAVWAVEGYWTCEVPAGITSCTIRGLTPGRYHFTVLASNEFGESARSTASNPVSVRWRPLPPTLNGWNSEDKSSFRGAPLVFGPTYTVPRGTTVSRVLLIAVSNRGKHVASGRRVALPPGTYRLTQRVWYTASDGRPRVVSRTQTILVSRVNLYPREVWARLEAGWNWNPSYRSRWAACVAYVYQGFSHYPGWVTTMAQATGITYNQAASVFTRDVFRSFYGSRCGPYLS